MTERMTAGGDVRLRATLPGVTVAVVALLVTGTIWWGSADLVAASTPQSRAARLVPADGTRQYARDGQDVLTTETALFGGPQLAGASPLSVAGAILQARGGAISDLHAWRSTTTSSAAVSGSSQVTTLRAVTARGIEQLATYGVVTLVFTPALLEVPADVHDGSTWTSAGTARPDGSLRYDSTWQAALVAGRPTCVRVTGTIHFTDKAGAAVSDSDSDQTWCDGLGAATTGAASAAGPAPYTGPTETPPANLAGVAGWRSILVPTATANDAFGPEPYRPKVDLPPVRLSDYTLVLPDGGANDIVGLTTPDTTLQKQWVGHPGGVVTALGAVGSVSMVGSSARTLSAYGPYGTWLWTRQLGEVPVSAPLDVGDGRAIITSLDGHVEVLQAATGEKVWETMMSAEVRLPPVTVGRILVVADGSGYLATFDLATGKPLWGQQVGTVEALGRSSDTVVARVGDSVRGWSAADGHLLWTTPLDGVGHEVLSVGDLVVVATSDATVGLDPVTGAVRWRASGSSTAIGLGGNVFQVSGDRVRALDTRGSVVHEWTPTGLDPRLTWYLVPSPTGIDVVDGDGAVVRIAP
ncbi:MAG: PQQ-binding-like beta-propeller repeat protein [Lapillicoccus sp.]